MRDFKFIRGYDESYSIQSGNSFNMVGEVFTHQIISSNILTGETLIYNIVLRRDVIQYKREPHYDSSHLIDWCITPVESIPTDRIFQFRGSMEQFLENLCPYEIPTIINILSYRNWLRFSFQFYNQETFGLNDNLLIEYIR